VIRDGSFAVICRRFGVSRRIGYKWLARYREAGVEGLFNRPRAPLHHPQAVADEIAERCLEVRRAHPTWGPLKVRAYLERKVPAAEWPAASTIGELFDRAGLTVKRKLRRRSPPSSAPFAHCETANDVWCIDFKGWFLTGDGKRCEPLTLTDAYSRYLLRCQALERTDTDHVWPVLDAAFREFGLPHHMRSDHGSPFASRGAGGLSKLSVKLIKAGVVPERIAPGKPQQNGRHERMHLTLLQDTADPPADSLRQQLKRLRDFQLLYNRASEHPSGYVIDFARLEAVAVEKSGNQIVAGDQHQLTHGLDDIGRGAVALSAPALRQAQRAVGAPHPVDDENDLRGRVVDIGHDLVDQGAHDALLDTGIGRRR
jgi:putative transposase